MNENEENRRKNIERSLRARGRKVIDWWDGEPIHQPMTPYEKYAESQKGMGVEVIDEATFNLGLSLLGHKNGLDVIFKKP